MTEPLAGFDWLATQVESTQLRLLLSAAVVGGLVVVLLNYHRLQGWISVRSRPLYGDLVATTLAITTCGLSLAIVLGLWEQTGLVAEAYASQGLSGAVLPNAVVSFVLVVGTVIVMRFFNRVIDELLSAAKGVTDHQREITRRVAQVIVWSLTVVVVLGVWIDDLSGVLVGAGFLGIVVGMAARQTLGTMLAGFVLMFSRPFEIGDWIVVDEEQGIVTDISIVNTRVRTFDGEYVMIPNDVVASRMVTNRSRGGTLRVDVEVGVDYETDLERAKELAETAVSDLEHAVQSPAPRVVTKRFADSAVILGVRFWIGEADARTESTARTDAIGAIKRAFQADGIRIPFPQRTVSDRDETITPPSREVTSPTPAERE